MNGSAWALIEWYRTKPNRYRRKALVTQISKVHLTNALYKRLRGYSSDLELINLSLMTLGLPSMSCNQETTAKAVFQGTIVRAFEKSASAFSGDLEDRVFNLIL